ncbi:MAG: hypothetical protein ACT4PT_10655, partial [Methanobacteriota archaeon]
SLVASIVSPVPGAGVRGAVPVRLAAGAVPIAAGGDPEVTIRLDLATDGVNFTVPLLNTTWFIPTPTNASAEPARDWYPVELDTRLFPDSDRAVLRLTVANDNETVVREAMLFLDNTPPATRVVLEGTRGENGWMRSPVVVGLEGVDATSGVASLRYALDADVPTATFEPERKPRVASGVHRLVVSAVDRAGNPEPVTTHSVRIDTAPPSLSLTLAEGAAATGSEVVLGTLRLSDGAGGSGPGVYRAATRLGTWSPWASIPAGGVARFEVDLGPGDGVREVFVEAKDAAGNVADTKATIVLETAAPVLLSFTPQDVDHTRASVLVRSDKPAAARVEFGAGDRFDRAVETRVFRTEHRLDLSDLLPGSEYAVRVVLEDRVGNKAVRGTDGFGTRADRTPPTGVGAVAVSDLGTAEVRLAWTPAEDDVGLAPYRVFRAVEGGDEVLVGEAVAAEYRDETPPPGRLLRYRVQARDLAGNLGPVSPEARGVATTAPSLVDGGVDPPFGTTRTDFTFRVTVRDADGDVPRSVRVVVDGEALALVRESGTDPRVGITYARSRLLSETTLSGGLHTYHFEAHDGSLAGRFPALGVRSGPAVQAVAGDAPGLIAAFRTMTAVAGFEVVALVAVALAVGAAGILRRRSRP